MPVLKANFAEVPDTRPKLSSGIYRMRILSLIAEASTNPDVLAKNKDATNFVFEFELLNEGQFKGWKQKRWIPTVMETELKRLALSCGIEKAHLEGPEVKQNGFDFDLLVGKTCVGEIAPNVYTHKKTGQQVEGMQISQFFIPGEPDYQKAN